MHESVLTHGEFSGSKKKDLTVKSRSVLLEKLKTCWSSPARCANWARFELIHLQFKYPGWGNDDDGTEERGSRESPLSVPPHFWRERATKTAHLGPPTWTNWTWYQDVSSSLQTSSPSPASPTRTGSAPETLPVGSFSLWAVKLEFYFNLMLNLCPWFSLKTLHRTETKVGTCSTYVTLVVTITTIHGIGMTKKQESNVGIKPESILTLMTRDQTHIFI